MDAPVPDPDPPPSTRPSGTFAAIRRPKRDTNDQLVEAGAELEGRVLALERLRRRFIGLVMAALTTAAGSAIAAVKGIASKIEADTRAQIEREQLQRDVRELREAVRELQRRPDPNYWPTAPWGHPAPTPDPKGPPQ